MRRTVSMLWHSLGFSVGRQTLRSGAALAPPSPPYQREPCCCVTFDPEAAFVPLGSAAAAVLVPSGARADGFKPKPRPADVLRVLWGRRARLTQHPAQSTHTKYQVQHARNTRITASFIISSGTFFRNSGIEAMGRTRTAPVPRVNRKRLDFRLQRV